LAEVYLDGMELLSVMKETSPKRAKIIMKYSDEEVRVH
jgi:hypothetical protein